MIARDRTTASIGTMDRMRIDAPCALLGGISAETFMRRHWQKKPLLVRRAMPGIAAPVSRTQLFALAARDDVESRLVSRSDGQWHVRHGPIARRSLPPLARREWTLLVQGVDLHVEAAHDLLQCFRFVPDARLDDLMVSFASDGGGVGPHYDSYDVFLLQAQGRRRWRIGRLRDPALRNDVPLKILSAMQVEDEWLLDPGDMLYLPPLWAHDGIGEGACMSCSIGFRAASAGALAQELLVRIAERIDDDAALYRDAAQSATRTPGRIPSGLHSFAVTALRRAFRRADRIDEALGEWLTEPKPGTWFEAGRAIPAGLGATLDRRSRMLYDRGRVYLNGEAFRAAGRDFVMAKRLADRRRLTPREVETLGEQAREQLQQWARAGWLHADDPEDKR